jgi:DNA repair protein RadC
MTKHSLWVRDAETDALREATHEEIIRAARSCLARRVVKGAVLQSPGATRDFILVELSERSHESFCVLYLDNRHRVISWQEIFRGTIDGASVHPREVVKEALSRCAAACILVHNHPSGVAEPSQADELITHRLRDAMALVDIRILDHLIVAGTTVLSFAERGLI